MVVQGPPAAAVISTDWLLLSISVALILARLYLRLKIKRRSLVISDAFICLAWCSSVSTWSFDIVFAHMGFLRPDMDYFFSAFTGDTKTLQTALMVCDYNSLST